MTGHAFVDAAIIVGVAALVGRLLADLLPRGVAALLAIVGIVLVTAYYGAPASYRGPTSASCRTLPLSSDPYAPADFCGVQVVHITGSLPWVVGAPAVAVGLYAETAATCLPGLVICNIDDNRPFVAAGNAAPHASTTRFRALVRLDFARGAMQIDVTPSCGLDRYAQAATAKTCIAPARGSGATKVVVHRVDATTIDLALRVPQVDFVRGRMPIAIYDQWRIRVDHGKVTLKGRGSRYPDFVLIVHGRILYSLQGTTSAAAFLPPVQALQRVDSFGG